jgi:DNA-binding MarR family transcriptional regulator
MEEGLNYLQTFNPVESKAKLLEKTLTGRKDLVDLLEELVVESATSGNKFQRLIIGPRGSGKTHLLRVLYNRVSGRDDLKNKLKIAYLCEDEYGIASFLDFIIRIFKAFIKWYPEDSSYLDDEINKLKKVPSADQGKGAVNILLKHIEGTTLLIVVENIGNIFEGIGVDGQRKLRDLVQQYPCFTIMASNQALFKDVQKEDRPFHNFFKINHLKKLTLDESILFLKSIAEWEEKKNLLRFLDEPEGRGRINAIYDITGGNHRLLVTFYNFLKIDYKNDLSYSFIKTINDLIPYYQSFMNLLSPLPQKIVQHLCQTRKPSNVKEIAENCFSTPSTISKQMSNLVKLKYVDATPSGKETFYELTEPLLRICFEVKENRSTPIKLFVDFLGNLYSAEEIKKKYNHFRILFEESDGKSTHWYKEWLFYKDALKQYYPDIYSLIKNLEKNETEIKRIVQATNNQSRVKEHSPEYGTIKKTGGQTSFFYRILKHFEENLTTLFIHGSKDNISRYLREAFGLIEKYNYREQFFKAMPQAIFEILIQHDEIETKRFEWIETILNETFKDNQDMVVALQFLNIGIRHLKKNEKNALLQFTKEERNTFKKFVLDKIKKV